MNQSKKQQNQSPKNPAFTPALGYHWLTPYYDWFTNITNQMNHFYSALIDQIAVESHDQILDVSCGTGSLAIHIKHRFPDSQVTALDCDPEMLKRAQHKANQEKLTIQFDQFFAEYLPYPDQSFDCVVSSLFFHHLNWRNKEKVAKGIYRVLKPQGELYVLDWGRATNRLMRMLFFTVQFLDGFENTRDHVTGKLPELFINTGFTQVKHTQNFNTIFGTLALYRVIKNN